MMWTLGWDRIPRVVLHGGKAGRVRIHQSNATLDCLFFFSFFWNLFSFRSRHSSINSNDLTITRTDNRARQTLTCGKPGMRSEGAVRNRFRDVAKEMGDRKQDSDWLQTGGI